MQDDSNESVALEFVFDAFISYNRNDIEFATALESALESYSPPKDLGLPVRRLEVFRDIR